MVVLKLEPEEYSGFRGVVFDNEGGNGCGCCVNGGTDDCG